MPHQIVCGIPNSSVYFVQSHKSYPKLKGWLCGGALVRTNKILTAAACLIESSNLYAIAGYKTYVSTKQLDVDNCTKLMRRRVIKSCVPVDYVYDPSNSTRWMTLDVGVAIVDRAYRADDVQFRILCDYIPKPVAILFAKNYIYDGQDAITLGWGFERGRRPGDIEDFNSKRLKYIVTQIQPLKPCKDAYPGMNETIDKYMLCLDVRGDMDDDGNPMYSHVFAEWCTSRRQSESGFNCTEHFAKQAEVDNNKTSINQTQADSRRQYMNYGNTSYALCQNDHGGPLIAYVGSAEMLIGVAVNTLYYADTYRCTGPSLYTSTVSTGNIIKCMLAQKSHTRRSCSRTIEEEGFRILRRSYDWQEESADIEEDPADLE